MVLAGPTGDERNLSRLFGSSEGSAAAAVAVIEGVESNVAPRLLSNGWAQPAGADGFFFLLLLPSRP